MDNPRLSLIERLPHVAHYECVVCGTTYHLDEVSYTCPTCGDVGTLDVIYKADGHFYTPDERPINFWQQRDILPLAQEAPEAIQNLGNTPFVQGEFLQDWARKIGVAEISLKNDGLNLTGSFKDRASAMVVAHALHNLKVSTIATGGLLLIGLSLVLMDIKRPPMANYLPALLIAPLIVAAGSWLGIDVYPDL